MCVAQDNRVRLIVALPPPYDANDKTHLPWGALVIASVLERQGIDVDVFDFQNVERDSNDYSVTEFAKRILEGPRVVGISVMCDGLPLVALACEEAKRIDPDKFIVLGGSGPAFIAKQLLDHFRSIDAVVIGEGEETAKELFPLILGARRSDLNRVKGIVFRDGNNVVTTEPRPIMELDSIPLPAYHLVDVSSYGEVGILTSRGCPYSCSFCSTSPLWGKRVRHRSAGNVVHEMELLVSLGRGSKDKPVSFLDDLFTDSTHYVRSVCSAIRDRQLDAVWRCLARVDTLTDEALVSMTSAGCEGLSIGIESGSDRVLRAMRKGITSREALAAATRVFTHIDDAKFFFIWGFPFEYPIDLVQTAVLIREMLSRFHGKQNFVMGINLAAPLPGSAGLYPFVRTLC